MAEASLPSDPELADGARHPHKLTWVQAIEHARTSQDEHEKAPSPGLFSRRRTHHCAVAPEVEHFDGSKRRRSSLGHISLHRQFSRIASFSRSNSRMDAPQTVDPSDIDPKGWDRLVISQNNVYKAAFDMIVAICVLFTAIAVPIELAYRYEFPLAVDTLLDVVFILDVVLQFFQGYEELGFPVTHLPKVARRYLRSWFALDSFAAVPLDNIFAGAKPLKLVKTIRLLRIKRLMMKLQGQAGGQILRVIVVVGLWLLVTHWFACGFLIIGWNECTTGETWVLTYPRWAVIPQFVEHCRAGIAPHLTIDPSPPSIYVRTFAWALSTMSSLGYGNAPVAITDAEHVFAVCAQVTGACLAAAIFGNIAQMINKGDAVAVRYQALYDKITEFNRFHKLPRGLRSKLHAYNDLLFAINRGFDLHQIASIFPVNLQEDIFFLLHEHLLRKVPIFDGCHTEFVRALARQLRAEVLLAGDYAFKMNEMGKSMYFLQTGFMQIGNGDFTVVYATLKSGAYFGELAMFTSQRRTASARALRNCVLYTVSVTHFEETIQMHPKYYETILNKAMEQLENTMQANTSMEARMQTLGAKHILETRRRSTSSKLGSQRSDAAMLRADSDGAEAEICVPASEEENGSQRGKRMAKSGSDWNLLRKLVAPKCDASVRSERSASRRAHASSTTLADGEAPVDAGEASRSRPAHPDDPVKTLAPVSALATESLASASASAPAALSANDAPEAGDDALPKGTCPSQVGSRRSSGASSSSPSPQANNRRSLQRAESDMSNTPSRLRQPTTAAAPSTATPGAPERLLARSSTMTMSRSSEQASPNYKTRTGSFGARRGLSLRRFGAQKLSQIATSMRLNANPECADGAADAEPSTQSNPLAERSEARSEALSEGGWNSIKQQMQLGRFSGSRRASIADFLPTENSSPPEESYAEFEGVSFQAMVRQKYKQWHASKIAGSRRNSDDAVTIANDLKRLTEPDGNNQEKRNRLDASSLDALASFASTLEKIQTTIQEMGVQMKRLADKVDAASLPAHNGDATVHALAGSRLQDSRIMDAGLETLSEEDEAHHTSDQNGSDPM
ncbi:hypothetical protein AB1Y20_022314 [Prymnesium parvum]|uniref:Cyclic nucleotide-binding domain-containing protein n=1 Tax=Prymnesium parvum TaxID=97485 RepID=A0AB34JIG6_PRYPA